MRTSIWFVRHGQTVLNKARRYQGTSESVLTAFGEQQAVAAGVFLRRTPLHTAIVSPAGRAQRTAKLILGERLPVLQIDPNWAETNHGRWEGLTYREVRERFPEEAVTRFSDALHGRALGGESLAEVQTRVLHGWQALLHNHPGGRVLVVTHATPIQLIVCHLSNLSPALHWRWRIDLGSITVIDMFGESAIVRMVNHVPAFVQH